MHRQPIGVSLDVCLVTAAVERCVYANVLLREASAS
jgi:hypothetical protein